MIRSARGTAVAAAAMVAALGLVLSGCDSGGEEASSTPNSRANASASRPGVTVLVSPPTGASLAALGGGELEVLGGCLGAGGDVVVWPPGTTVVVNDPLKISIPKLGTYAIGDTVRLGGGYIREQSEKSMKPLRIGSVDVTKSCLRYDVFLAGPAT